MPVFAPWTTPPLSNTNTALVFGRSSVIDLRIPSDDILSDQLQVLLQGLCLQEAVDITASLWPHHAAALSNRMKTADKPLLAPMDALDLAGLAHAVRVLATTDDAMLLARARLRWGPACVSHRPTDMPSDMLPAGCNGTRRCLSTVCQKCQFQFRRTVSHACDGSQQPSTAARCRTVYAATIESQTFLPSCKAAAQLLGLRGCLCELQRAAGEPGEGPVHKGRPQVQALLRGESKVMSEQQQQQHDLCRTSERDCIVTAECKCDVADNAGGVLLLCATSPSICILFLSFRC